MSENFPTPLVPPDVDLADFEFMQEEYSWESLGDAAERVIAKLASKLEARET